MTAIKARQTRKKLGMTQRQLGEKLGMTAQQISNYENGRSPVPRVVELAMDRLMAQECYDEEAFFEDWNREDMEAYNAL